MTLQGPISLPADGSAPKQLVMLLHGYGADGNDLISLSEPLREVLPNAVFISPNAPFQCEMSPFGYQWFSLNNWGEGDILKGLEKAKPYLDETIEHALEEYQLDESDLLYVGFSQGCMISLYTSLRREKQCAGVVGFSGLYVEEEGFIPNAKPPIQLIHGDMDPVVPYTSLADAEAKLKAQSVDVAAHTSQGVMHGIAPDGLEVAMQFIQRIFP